MNRQQKLASIYKMLMLNKIFHHFKGTDYRVTDIAVYSETGELRVIYKSKDDSEMSWDRNIEMFLSLVDKAKYPNVEQTMRFQPYDKEFSFHCIRRTFAISKENTLMYGPVGLSHEEWLIQFENYTKEQYFNTVRGFVDTEGIYFYQGDFETNDTVERFAKIFKNEINQESKLPVYCGFFKGEIGSRWKPIIELK